MPHIIIETDRATADGIDAARLVGALHNTLADQETVSKASIKTRLLIAEASMAGEDEVPGFMATTVKLLPGRSDALKEQMAEALLGVVRETVPESVATSVEIVELGIYRK